MQPDNGASRQPSDEGHVLVIGAAGIDVKGRPDEPLQKATSTPGYIRFSLGGVARNIAENLARLDISTVLLTAIGDDANGQVVLDGSRAAGVDVSHVARIPGGRTGSYMALITDTYDLDVGISDYSIIEHLTPDFLRGHAHLFQDAAMIAIDANLSTEALATVFELADEYRVPVCADPSSTLLAGKLCDYVGKMYMIAPNSAETTALCGVSMPAEDIETATKVARYLVSLGAQIAIITLGAKGLAYANSSSSGHIPAIHTHVVDPTGAGDALTAGVIFGLLNDVPLDEALRLGVSAATLTLRTQESVVPGLSQELLYDELVI
jgi:pseudouridine kinase